VQLLLVLRSDQRPVVQFEAPPVSQLHSHWAPGDEFLLLPGDGLILVNADGQIRFFDHRARLLHHGLGAKALGLPVDELWPELAAALEHYSIAVEQQGPLDTRVDLHGKPRVVRLFRTDDGMGIALLAKRPSAHGLASQQQLMHQNILAQLRDAVIVTTAEPIAPPGPVIVYANPAALRQTGYQLKELVGRSPRLFQGPRTDPAALRTFHEALTHWQPVRQVVLNYRKNRSTFWVEIGITPLSDQDGWHTFWVSVQRECHAPSAGHPPAGHPAER
jgi:PAS domain S-box-containing protein